MKTRFVHSLFLTLASLLFVTTARAELLVYEPFDYDTGDIDGQNGGMGFGSEWVVNSGFTFEVVDPGGPMQYVMPGGGTISGGNRALRFGNDSFGDVLADEVDSLKREFDDIHEFDEVYISFLYRYDPEGYIDDNDFVVWWFNDRGGPQLGLKGNGGDGSLTDDFVGRVSGAFAAPQQAFVPDVDISDEAGTMGETFFLVGKMARADYSDTPLDYDEFSIWVNPSANEMNAPHAVATGAPGDILVDSLESLGMRTFSQEEFDAMYWDEIRIGTTWADVTTAEGGDPALQAGDANMDLEFNQLDLVKVQIAAKYLTGLAATWGDGDWDGAPGGSPGNPPPGNGKFDQLDIIAALAGGVYLKGPYAAVRPGGSAGDGQTSIMYHAGTGEVSVDAPSGVELTSINIDSAASIFTGAAAANLGGSFDNDADNNIFKATFGSSFGSLSFGSVAQAGLSEQFVLNDLTVVGSLAGGGALGNVDLIYVPEPSTILLLGLAVFTALVLRPRRR